MADIEISWVNRKNKNVVVDEIKPTPKPTPKLPERSVKEVKDVQEVVELKDVSDSQEEILPEKLQVEEIPETQNQKELQQPDEPLLAQKNTKKGLFKRSSDLKPTNQKSSSNTFLALGLFGVGLVSLFCFNSSRPPSNNLWLK